MQVTVCGVGYTGLVISVCLCEFGHIVKGFDSNSNLIEALQSNCIIPSIIEPWLSTSLQKYVDFKKLSFSDDLNLALQDSDIVMITIPVKGIDGNDIDLSALSKILNQVALHLSREKYILIILQTAVPLGTMEILARQLESLRPDLVFGTHYDFVYNPTFFREGFGINDFMCPDRIVLGLRQQTDLNHNIIEQLYKNINLDSVPFIYTNYETAELIKSVSMSLVTIKMAFTNEIEQFCKNTDIDIDSFIKGVASDRRISSDSLMFNAGVGGSSLPRTARLLIKSAKQFGADLSILTTALESNAKRIKRIYDQILSYCNNKIQKATVFGLTFKPLTDDYQESPSMFVINQLMKSGIEIALYDPYFVSKNIDKIPNSLKTNQYFKIYDSAYEAVSQSDAIIAMTNCPEFSNLDMSKIVELMNKRINNRPLLFDCLNLYCRYEKEFNYIAA